MSRKIPTGIFLTKAENVGMIQFYGQAAEHQKPEDIKLHQDILAALGTKYNFNWKEIEITQEGEIIQVVKEKEDATK